MIRFAPLAIAVALVLGGCAGSSTPTLALGDACNSFANALDKLTPLKAAGKLDANTVGFVDAAITLTQPICSTGTAPASIGDAIALVSGEASAILGIVGKQ